MTAIASVAVIVFSETQSVLGVVDAHSVSHCFPLTVESVSIASLYASKHISALLGTACTADSLGHDLATLSVHHPFMGHLLVPVACVLVHLMTLSDSVSVTESSINFCGVSFFDWPAILVLLGRGLRLHLHEASLTHAATVSTHTHRLSHGSLHFVAHIVKNFE